jgi:hypothetical protein
MFVIFPWSMIAFCGKSLASLIVTFIPAFELHKMSRERDSQSLHTAAREIMH